MGDCRKKFEPEGRVVSRNLTAVCFRVVVGYCVPRLFTWLLSNRVGRNDKHLAGCLSDQLVRTDYSITPAGLTGCRSRKISSK